MQTNYQPQVKMTAKTKLGNAQREAVSVAPNRADEAPGRLSAASRMSKPVGLANSGLKTNVVPLSRAVERREPDWFYHLVKRTFDLVFGSLLLVIALPVILLAALAIRIDTPGSPFFFQTRLGMRGKPFRIFKLRGMFIDARSRFPGFYDYSGKRDLEFCFHHEDDPRVTRAGRFIRKTSIDELPNLWNVVLGDMSLVGPRPEIPDVLALYGSYREDYLCVKPGITCLSKITGRDRLTKRETIEFDLEYVRKRRFGLDLQILWRTFCNVILRRDVF